MVADYPNIHKAMNYETLLLAGDGGEATLGPVFDTLSQVLDISDPLPLHVKAYCEASGINEYALSEAYYQVRSSFSKLTSSDVILCKGDPLWPAGIQSFPQMPRFLYLRGDVSLLERPAVSVVGTRSPSAQGKQTALETVKVLGEAGYVVMSGLAKGIDGVAHLNALKHDIPTIAVIGTPLHQSYPSEHEPIQKLIGEHGLVVSRFSPVCDTQKWFFLLRNRLMSALSEASVIVEDRDGGGAVRQAEFALEQKKFIFMFQHTVNNKAYLWPRQFSCKPRVFTVRNATSIPKQLEKAKDLVKGFPVQKTEEKTVVRRRKKPVEDPSQLGLF